MKKLLIAAGMVGMALMSAAPANAAQTRDLIPSVVIHEGTTQGATNACAGLENASGKNKAAQLARHGCTSETPAPSAPVTPEPEPAPVQDSEPEIYFY